MARRNDEVMDEIEVKVARTGGEVKTVLLNGDRTVADALDAASISYDENSRIRVNGEEVDLDDVLKDGERVVLSGKIKGGL